MLRKAISSVVNKRLMTAVSIPKTQKVILINETGGYDVLKYQDYSVPSINANELLVKNKYSGINFIEAYFRKGLYPSEKPYILGREASGTIVAKGDNVKDFEIGDKVAYLSGSAFAQYTSVSAEGKVVKLPRDSSDETLKLYAAGLLQSLTALTFINEAHNVKKGEYILVYAAAGGVGLILDQLVSARGAHVIAVASTDAKIELAKKYGAEYGIVSTKEDIVAKVRDITKGQGVDAAFDSVGKDTFKTTVDALRSKGTFVSYGNSSGLVDSFALTSLPRNIKILRAGVFGYVATQEEWQHYSKKVVYLIDSKKLKINIGKVFPLSEYSEATKELESRKTTGKLVLDIPQ